MIYSKADFNVFGPCEFIIIIIFIINQHIHIGLSDSRRIKHQSDGCWTSITICKSHTAISVVYRLERMVFSLADDPFYN